MFVVLLSALCFITPIITDFIVLVESYQILIQHLEISKLSNQTVFKVWNFSDLFFGYHIKNQSYFSIPTKGVISVEKNQVFRVQQENIVYQTNAPWYLKRISNRGYENDSFGFLNPSGQNVSIYIVDTGIDPFHQDFIIGYNNKTKCYDTRVQLLYPSNAPTFDDNGHGTMVSSLAGGTLHGIAKNASIIGVKVLDSDGNGLTSDIITGLEWIAARVKIGNEGFGKSVVNLSLGSDKSDSVNRAVEALISLGVPVVVAAGNEGTSACSFSPSSANGVIAVGSINIDNYLSSFSNTGSCVSLLAPGEDIIAAGLHSGGNCSTISYSTNQASGTSFSSPLVAGIVAIYLSHDNLRGTNSLFSRSSGQSFVSDVRNMLLQQATRGIADIGIHFRTSDSLAYSFPFGLGRGQTWSNKI